MGISSSSLNMTNLYNNPQLLGTLFPTINMQAINAAFQVQQIQVQQPIAEASTQLSSLSAPLSAWQSLQADLQALQSDATSLGGTSLYQGITASSSNAAEVSATGSGQGTFGSYQVQVNNLIQSEIDNSAGQANSSTALGYSGTFSINGVSVTVASTDTLAQIASDINNASTGVTATVMNTGSGSTPYVLNLASTQGQAVTWYDPNGILQSLGILNSNGTVADQIQAPKAASYSINGVSLTSVTNSDSTTIPGVTLNLLASTGGSPVTVTVSQNTGAIQAAVGQFVNDFNKFLADSQKYAGKGGAIEGNATIGSISDQLMQILNSTVSGQPSTMDSVAQAGLSLSAPVGSPDQFALALDSTTLQSSLQSDPAAVASLWNGTSGVATQVQTLLNNVLGADGGVSAAISDLQQQQQQLSNEISSPTSTLNQIVNAQMQALQAQFNNLMTTLVSLSSQSSTISTYMNMQYTMALQQAGGGGAVG
jgi:flagellar hook-associated protein 2